MLGDGDDGEQAGELLNRANALVVGPGLVREPWGEKLFRLALAAGKPAVMDADGLRWLRRAQPGAPSTAVRIITPHSGEAAELLQVSAKEVEADRPGAAQQLADKFDGVAVLKGAGTVCAAPGGELLGVCAHGNPGMATAGMGDVLAGVLGGLLAQGMGAADAVRSGVCLHGAAADLAAGRQGQRSLLATDVIDAIGELTH